MDTIILLAMLCLPLKHLAVTSPYGFRVHPVTGRCAFHNGIDLRADQDTVFAIGPGRVKAGYDPVSGLYITIDHGELQSGYAHLSQLLVLPGDSVTAGCPVAVSGASGRTTGPHLHFSLKYQHRYINPMLYLAWLINQFYSPIKKSKSHEQTIQITAGANR